MREHAQMLRGCRPCGMARDHAGRRQMRESVLRNQRYDVDEMRARRAGAFGDGADMMVIDSRNQHGVDLDGQPERSRAGDALELIGDQSLGGRDAVDALALPRDLRGDLRLDQRIDGIDRHRQRRDADRCNLLDALGQHQAVRRQAQHQLRPALVHQGKCAERVRRRQRIAGAGDADHIDRGTQLQRPLDDVDRLLRRQQPCGDAGTLVAPVEIANAERAINVAARADRQV